MKTLYRNPFSFHCYVWVCSVGLAIFSITGCEREPVEIGATVYKETKLTAACEEGSRIGKAGLNNDQSTPENVRFNLRTPSNYKPTIGHPLIIVYPPAGRSSYSTERMTNLTLPATRAGFVIAYPSHKGLSSKTLEIFGKLPKLISEKWCIDSKRIYLTGHSDGGTVAMGLAFMDETRHIPNAIAPSAAGIQRTDLAEYSCPEPISVMIMHSSEDSLFPGFGKQAADWWAACNQCEQSARPVSKDGCYEYAACAQGTKTWYCEGTERHGAWPGLNLKILEFFGATVKPAPVDAITNR